MTAQFLHARPDFAMHRQCCLSAGSRRAKESDAAVTPRFGPPLELFLAVCGCASGGEEDNVPVLVWGPATAVVLLLLLSLLLLPLLLLLLPLQWQLAVGLAQELHVLRLLWPSFPLYFVADGAVLRLEADPMAVGVAVVGMAVGAILMPNLVGGGNWELSKEEAPSIGKVECTTSVPRAPASVRLARGSSEVQINAGVCSSTVSTSSPPRRSPAFSISLSHIALALFVHETVATPWRAPLPRILGLDEKKNCEQGNRREEKEKDGQGKRENKHKKK